MLSYLQFSDLLLSLFSKIPETRGMIIHSNELNDIDYREEVPLQNLGNYNYPMIASSYNCAEDKVKNLKIRPILFTLGNKKIFIKIDESSSFAWKLFYLRYLVEYISSIPARINFQPYVELLDTYNNLRASLTPEDLLRIEVDEDKRFFELPKELDLI